jgi:acyl-CoA synthetase (AMP-forming)/AMP-acid ligase II
MADSAPRIEWSCTADLVRDRARLGSKEAFVDGDTRLTYAELAQATGRAARAFRASGVAKGDRIAIWAPNIHEWVIAALGLQMIGAVLVPLNTRFRGAEAADILARSRARMLFTVRAFLGFDYPAALRETGAATPNLQEIVVLRGDPGRDTSWAGFLARGDSEEQDLTSLAPATDDVSDIMFTSGTTGKPKGAMLRYGQMFRAVATVTGLVGLGEGDRYLIIPPFFHTFGYRFGFVNSILAGATGILMPTLQPDELLGLIHRERVTYMPGPPTLFHELMDSPNRHDMDISCLTKTLLGATTVPVELVRRLRAELRLQRVVTAYGMTETTGVGSITRPDDDDETVATTSGRPFPGTELIVAEEAGGEAPVGQPGEVWIRGFTVMAGYLDDPAATAQTITPDGWLRTGDVGVKDARGNLRIVDRMKDMFIVGGFNAYPAEIEGLMLRNAKIAQVSVVGAPDERLGEVACAFVRLKRDERSDAQEIIAWCRANMANYKAPRFVEFCDELPMNASGKVMKFALRERARELAKAQS